MTFPPCAQVPHETRFAFHQTRRVEPYAEFLIEQRQLSALLDPRIGEQQRTIQMFFAPQSRQRAREVIAGHGVLSVLQQRFDTIRQIVQPHNARNLRFEFAELGFGKQTAYMFLRELQQLG